MNGALWLVGAALLLISAVVAGVWISARAAAMRVRARRILADAMEPRSSFPTLVSIPAVHVRTVVARDLSDPLLPSFPAGVEVRLGTTESEVVFEDETQTEAWIPLKRVRESAFIPSFLGRKSPEGGAFLRVVWCRGEETLWTVFRVNLWVDAEKIRQQLHMRTHGSRE